MSLAVFVLGGSILIVAGLLQLFVRPPAAERARGRVGFDASLVRMVLFTVVGILAVLVGLGVIPFARLHY